MKFKGNDSVKDGPTSAVLQEVQLPVVPQVNCKKAYSAFEDQVIDDRVMCAGYTAGGKDSCKVRIHFFTVYFNKKKTRPDNKIYCLQGDSGGPLMTPFNQTYYLIGVVSYG